MKIAIQHSYAHVRYSHSKRDDDIPECCWKEHQKVMPKVRLALFSESAKFKAVRLP